MPIPAHSSKSKYSQERRKITFDSSGSTSSRSTTSDSTSTGTKTKPEVSLDLSKLRSDCIKLQKYALMQKTDPNLPTEHYELMMKVSDDLANTYAGDADGTYEKAHASLVEVFGDKKNAEPGSVAKYFVGCLEEVGSDGPVGCSPECAGNVPLPKGPGGIAVCDSHIGYYQKGQLEITYNPRKKSDIILIHQSAEKCVLGKEEIEELRSYGIERAVISVKEDGAWRTITPNPIRIEDLIPRTKKAPAKASAGRVVLAKKAGISPVAKPIVKGDRLGKHHKTDNHKHDDDDEGCSWGIWALVAFIFVIIIIFVVVCFFWKKGSNDSEDNNSAEYEKSPHKSSWKDSWNF